ncbi:TolC family protein [Hydrogenophaga soli]
MLMLAGLLAVASPGVQAELLAFDDAQRQLLARSDRLAASHQGVEGAELRRDATRNLGGPVLSLSGATYVYNASLNLDISPLGPALASTVAHLPPALRGAFAGLPSLPPSYTTRQHATQTTAAVTGVWPLYTGGATQAAQRLMGERVAEARAEAAQVHEEVDGVLVQRYFGAQLAQRAADLHQAALANIAQHDAAAQKMMDAGVMARVDRLQASVALEDARRQARKADDEAALAAVALTRTLKATEPVQPTSPLFVSSQPVEPLAHFVDLALAHHPGLAKVDAKKGQAEQLREAEDALRRPQVFAFGERQLKTGRDANWVAGVGVRWSLLDAIDRKTLAQASERDVQQAQRLKEQAQSDIELLVEKRWLALEQARRAYASLAPSVDLAQEVLRLRRAGVSAGTATPLELIDAELNVAKVQTEQARAAYDYVKALAELLESCGRTQDFTHYMAKADIQVK